MAQTTTPLGFSSPRGAFLILRFTVSLTRMVSPGGWEEPAQQPEFDEISVVLRGMLRVETEAGVIDVRAGQAVITQAGERVRYSTPEDAGAEYLAICISAFSPQTVDRLDDGQAS